MMNHSMDHNYLLVLLSYVIAATSAYAAIELARRVNRSAHWNRRIWIASGGMTLGLGIWAMHFIAMLSHAYLRQVTYSLPLVLGSIFLAIAGCVIAFAVVARNQTWPTLFIAASVMGSGIASMHYVGMASIRGASVTHDVRFVLLAFFIAVGASFAALWLGFFSKYASKKPPFEIKLGFALLMGTAIFGMHFVGMMGTTFSAERTDASFVPIEPTLLAWLISVMTVLLFGIFFVAILLERQLEKRDLMQQTILASTSDAVVTTSLEGQIHYTNPAFDRLFPNHPTSAYFQDVHRDLSIHQPLTSTHRFEHGAQTLDVTVYPLQDDSTNRLLWFLRDVSDMMDSQTLIAHMAYHDRLTDLPNRHKLEHMLTQYIQLEKPIGCLYIELSRWRFLSDVLGPDGIDVLTLQIKDRLAETIHPDDVLTRVGDAEFVVVLLDQRSTLATQKAEKCLKVLAKPFDVNGTSIDLTMNAGISHFPTDTACAQHLMQYARLAAQTATRVGDDPIQTFDLSSKSQILRDVEIEQALADPLVMNAMTLVYQPKVDLTRNRLAGVEALLRWQHPTLGELTPDAFIDIAERNGKIHLIGQWVMQEAFQAWRRWHQAGIAPVTLSLNVSPFQLVREDFVDTLQQLLFQTGMDPLYLELELTERSPLTYETTTRARLKQLQQLGILMSLDDFGAGFSSFRHLKDLPVQLIKIDRTLLADVLTNTKQEAVVRSMIQLGQNLGMHVLAEGIETSAQLEWLLQERCDYAQGFYFSRPLHEKEMVRHMKQVTTYLEFGTH